MYNTRKFLFLALGLFVLAVFTSPVIAEENYGNIPPDPNMMMTMGMSSIESIDLPFDPNDYNFLIYDCMGGENFIRQAMEKILGRELDPSEIRTAEQGNHVTAEDLATHDILIVGWDAGGGSKSGLAPNIIEAGITGRVILSGHDSDYHTVNVVIEDAATTFFIQEIDYILKGGGTGLVVCADPVSTFSWLPQSWGVAANNNGGTTIRPFTQDGLDSGIFDNLTPELMSGWSSSFHNTFTNWGDGFTAFELGQVGDSDKVVTIAAENFKPRRMYINKVDDVADPAGCIVPNDIYHYTIAFHAGPIDEPNVVITDYLPEGVDFISADPNNGTYYPRPEHQYVWFLGDVPAWDPNTPGDPNEYFTLTVQANTNAEPAGQLYNKVTAESDFSYNKAEEYTPVCCWGGNIVYVDRDAPGPHIGTGWATAYYDIQDAIARAAVGCGSQIWVADGTYRPGNDSSDSFEIPDNVSVYGGYPGYGFPDPNFCNPKQFPTILSGYIDESTRNSTVVKMGQNCLLDGCTVEEAGEKGIDGSDVISTVANCVIENNAQRGIYCENGNLTVQWCEITNNGERGIRHEGNGNLLTIENCKIYDNQYDGILTISSTSTILNSLVYQNGSGGNYYGINIGNPSSSPTIRNNTVVHNFNEGIRFVGSYTPIIRNNILYYNNGSGLQLAGLSEKQVFYCCLPDCNDVNIRHNIDDAPMFAYDKAPYGYYHLRSESPCIDKGDPSLSYDERVDIDNEPREMGLEADIGADEVEVSCDDTWNENDWTYDGTINLEEFAIFSSAWQSHDPNDPVCNPNDPGYVGDPNAPGYISESAKAHWNPKCNLDSSGDSEYAIDMDDFVMFLYDWLWRACWYDDYSVVMYGQNYSGGGEQMMMSIPIPTPEPETLYEQSMQTEIVTYKEQEVKK